MAAVGHRNSLVAGGSYVWEGATENKIGTDKRQKGSLEGGRAHSCLFSHFPLPPLVSRSYHLTLPLPRTHRTTTQECSFARRQSVLYCAQPFARLVALVVSGSVSGLSVGVTAVPLHGSAFVTVFDYYLLPLSSPRITTAPSAPLPFPSLRNEYQHDDDSFPPRRSLGPPLLLVPTISIECDFDLSLSLSLNLTLILTLSPTLTFLSPIYLGLKSVSLRASHRTRFISHLIAPCYSGALDRCPGTRLPLDCSLLLRSLSSASPSPPPPYTHTLTEKPVDKMHGSYHWQLERILSVAVLPLCVIPLVTGPSKTVDFLLGFLMPLHCHLGFGQIITDYFNKRKIGSMGSGLLVATLYAATALTTYGLYQFNTNDIGITEFVKRLWQGKQVSNKDRVEKPSA